MYCVHLHTLVANNLATLGAFFVFLNTVKIKSPISPERITKFTLRKSVQNVIVRLKDHGTRNQAT